MPAILTGARNPRGSVLLAHGIFCDKTEFGRFDRLAATLAEFGFGSLRFDFRGHGEHALPSLEATIGGMVLDFATALEYLAASGAGPVSCVAASFGGSVALLHLQAGFRVRPQRLILLNPVVEYGSTFLEPRGEIMRQTFTAAKWASLEQVGYIEPIPGVKLGRTFAAELALLRPYASFANSDVPTRIIHGTADRRVSHDVTRQYAMAAGRVDFVSIEDADHAFIPEPEERRSFELITDWLLRPDAAAGDADDTGLTVRRGDDMVAP